MLPVAANPKNLTVHMAVHQVAKPVMEQLCIFVMNVPILVLPEVPLRIVLHPKPLQSPAKQSAERSVIPVLARVIINTLVPARVINPAQEPFATANINLANVAMVMSGKAENVRRNAPILVLAEVPQIAVLRPKRLQSPAKQSAERSVIPVLARVIINTLVPARGINPAQEPLATANINLANVAMVMSGKAENVRRKKHQIAVQMKN